MVITEVAVEILAEKSKEGGRGGLARGRRGVHLVILLK